MADYTPTPADKFSFGLWTVGWQARDPFGDATRPHLDPVEAVYRLAELGAWGITFHDDDLIPFGAEDAARDEHIRRFRDALEKTGLVAPMLTTNLFTHPVFKDGAFTSNDRDVRRFAIRKVMRNIDLAAELGASTYVFWGGREGAETDAAKDLRRRARPLQGGARLALPVRHRPGLRPALRARAEAERAARRHVPADGRTRPRLHRVARAQRDGRPQPRGRARADGRASTSSTASPRRSGTASSSTSTSTASTASSTTRTSSSATATCRAPSTSSTCSRRAGYDGPRHFDYKPPRTEIGDDIWVTAAANMRTYLILRERAAAFRADPEVQEALQAARVDQLAVPTLDRGRVGRRPARRGVRRRRGRQALDVLRAARPARDRAHARGPLAPGPPASSALRSGARPWPAEPGDRPVVLGGADGDRGPSRPLRTQRS